MAGCGLSVQGVSEPPPQKDAGADPGKGDAPTAIPRPAERDAGTADTEAGLPPGCPAPSGSSGGELTIARLAKPVTIDGDLGEWGCASFFRFDRTNAAMIVGDGNVLNAYGFAVAWDVQAIYVAAHVMDPDPREGTNQTDLVFKNDSVEVYLAASDDLQTATYGDDDHQWVVDWANQSRTFRNGAGSAPSAEFRSAIKSTGPATYDVEIRIPATDTGRPKFAAAQRLAFAFAAGDSDGADRQTTWMTWHRPNLACSTGCCNVPCDKRFLERAVLAP
jgi:hypothetical protein